MAETFYGVLGVAEDADTETIHRAYREQVKEHHPDVSDDPNAPAQFKRLTTARDVLVDTDERSRYDRLGHGEYVSQYVDAPTWSGERPSDESASTSDRDQSRAASTGSSGTGTQSASDGGYDRTAWLGEETPGTHGRRHRQRQAHASGGTATAEEWQHASKAYRRADTDVGTHREPPLSSLLSTLRAIGPWLLVHLIFIGSAAATSWLAFSQIATYVDVSWPTLLLGVVLVGMTVFASVMHVVSQLYS